MVCVERIGRLIFWCFVCVLSGPLLAQTCPTDGSAPQFTVSQARGCALMSVTATNTALGAANIGYDFNFKGGTATVGISPQNQFVYSLPGSYTILQVGAGTNATGFTSCRVVEVLPTIPVSFSARVCANRQVTITLNPRELADTRYDRYQINWGDGTIDPIKPLAATTPADLQHQYANPVGGVIIRIEYTFSDLSIPQCSRFATNPPITVTTAPAVVPVISALATVDAGTITLRTQGGPQDKFEVQQRSATGTYQPTGQTAVDGQTVTIKTDATQTQCFQLVATDNCGNVTRSAEVCNLVLQASSGDKRNIVSWLPYPGTGTFRTYRLTRNGNVLPLTAATNKATATYTDTDNIQCNVPYCYALEASVNNGASTVTTAPVCVTGQNQDKPPALTNLLVDVDDSGQAQVRGILPTGNGTSSQYTLLVSRADKPGGPFTPVGEVNNNTVFRDPSANTSAQSYCYQITYRNVCGIESAPSRSACTIWLTSKSSAGIDWTADSPFAPGAVASYQVEIYDDDGNAIQTIPLGGNTHYDPDPNSPYRRYRIIAQPGPGGVGFSKSNFFEFQRNPTIFAPSAFTPNGDSENDRFEVKGRFWQTFSMTIFNRWGQALYSTEAEAEGWDGTLDGQPAPGGSYAYRVEVTDRDGQKTVKTGTVLLIR
jgi:gliding motility-associated-like protein